MQPYIDLCTPTWRPLDDNIRGFTVFSCSCNGSIELLFIANATLKMRRQGRPSVCKSRRDLTPRDITYTYS